ncbi:MAG: TLD domain-containing protein, partial [Alistipes sp.]|nr:TLD domain-containing protein [Alistipes sp.]
EKNKFGYYTPKKIEQISEYYNDSNSFLFSLKSNGRLNEMMKFPIKNPNESFWLYNKYSNWLISIGSDDRPASQTCVCRRRRAHVRHAVRWRSRRTPISSFRRCR